MRAEHYTVSANAMGVEDRLRMVLEEGVVGHAEGWCEKAEISLGYLSSYFTRARAAKAAGQREPGITLSTLEKLAGAANVRLEWLAEGRGPMRDEEGIELAPFDLARKMFVSGASDRDRATAWLSSSAFRMPSATNAREILDALESAYARHLRALEVSETGGTTREIGLALGGVGSRIDDSPDEEPRVLGPVKRKRR